MYGYGDIVGSYSDVWLLKLLYSFLMAAGQFFIINMFISVINTAATYIRENPEEQEYDKDLADFLAVSLEGLLISIPQCSISEFPDTLSQ